MTSMLYKSARELVKLIRSKALSPMELMEKTLQRIEAVNPALNAFVAMRAEQAMERSLAWSLVASCNKRRIIQTRFSSRLDRLDDKAVLVEACA